MLEYITYKKVKKHKAEKAAKEEVERMGESSNHGGKHGHANDTVEPGTPVLDPADESFLERLLNDEGPRPPLPPRIKTPDVDWVSDLEASSTFGPSGQEDVKGKKKQQVLEKDKEEKQGRLSRLFSRKNKDTDLVKAGDLPPDEKDREVSDVTRILNRLNLSTKNNKVVPLTADSSDLLNRFTQIFKDLANGVPTAYGDLVNLIEDREGTLNKGFNKLPKSLQKLVMQLPEKVTGNFAPEIMLAAAHAQGIKAEKGSGLKDQAGKIFMPKNIMEMVTKPGAIIGMLKAIVNALRLRWPAFIGMNVIWSVALFLLMFVLWYCYKRGREQRLAQGKNGEPIDGSDRIEELPDDLMIEGPPRRRETERSRNREWDEESYDSREEEERARRHKDDRDRHRDGHRRRDAERQRDWDSASHSSVEDDRARRHERYRRHDDMARREEEMQRREEELARREHEMSRRSSRR